MALKYPKIKYYRPQYSDEFIFVVFGGKMSKILEMRKKIYVKSFRPKRSFVKSVPGFADCAPTGTKRVVKVFFQKTSKSSP
jgi:hypothetical protein